MRLDLPRGWVSAALDEIFEPRSSRVSPSDYPDAPYVGLEQVEPHSNKLLGTVPASTMSSSAARFFTDDVLYGRMRPYLNKVASLPFDGLASAEFIVFPATEGVSSRFLLWRLSASDFVAFACSQYEGDRPRVKFDQLGKFQIHLPPTAEQARIVEKLEELLSDIDAGVAELKTAQKKLAQYRQSLLKSAVEGALTADWRASRSGTSVESADELLARILRERRARWEARQLVKFKELGKTPPKDWQAKYAEPVMPDTTGLPTLPEGWVWASAEQLCDFVTKGTTPPKELDIHRDKVIPFLRVTNLTDLGHLDLADRVFVSEETHRGFLSRSVVFPNDVLMNIVGPPLGQVSVVPNTFDEWNINQAIAIFRAVGGVLPGLLALNLLAPSAKKWFKARAKTTAGQTNLTLEVCRDLPVPLPPSVEQQVIVSAAEAAITGVSDQAEAIEISLKQSAAQRKNILQAAFAGKLVPQDPADEPASVLLERIRMDRAAYTADTTPARRRKNQ